MSIVPFGGLESGRLPIHDLEENRLKDLGIERSELVRRVGFKNAAKGIRRIEAMCAGDLVSLSAKMILKALPVALEVSEEIVQDKVHETAWVLEQNEKRTSAERDAAWRASFKPNAYLCGTETSPTSITMCAVTGGPERWLKIPIDYSQSAVTYATQALAVVRNKP